MLDSTTGSREDAGRRQQADMEDGGQEKESWNGSDSDIGYISVVEGSLYSSFMSNSHRTSQSIRTYMIS